MRSSIDTLFLTLRRASAVVAIPRERADAIINAPRRKKYKIDNRNEEEKMAWE